MGNVGCGRSEAVQIEVVNVARVDGNRGRSGGAAGGEIGDLGEAGGECVDGRFGLVFIIVAHCGDLAAQG